MRSRKGKSISFRPEPGIRERIEAIARVEERSLTWVVKKCVEDHLPELEEKYLGKPYPSSEGQHMIIEEKPQKPKTPKNRLNAET